MEDQEEIFKRLALGLRRSGGQGARAALVFRALVAAELAKERERCAKVADEVRCGADYEHCGCMDDIAAAIRALKDS